MVAALAKFFHANRPGSSRRSQRFGSDYCLRLGWLTVRPLHEGLTQVAACQHPTFHRTAGSGGLPSPGKAAARRWGLASLASCLFSTFWCCRVDPGPQEPCVLQAASSKDVKKSAIEVFHGALARKPQAVLSPSHPIPSPAHCPFSVCVVICSASTMVSA